MMSSLVEVARELGAVADRDSDTSITGVTHDSREVKPGWLYCCVPGANVDGHQFAADAVDAGAAALLTQRRLAVDAPQIVVDDVRRAMGPVACMIEGYPSRELTVVGVTGTNGKSSVVQLLVDIWAQNGDRADIVGTMTGARTTPEAPELQRQLRGAVARGATALAMEVSSHALEMSRVGGIHFAAAVFTNLGRDHLDFHGDMETYFRAKAALFDSSYTSTAVVNLDDGYGLRLGGRLLDDPEVDLHGYRLDDAEDIVVDGARSHFRWRGLPVVLHLVGRHNILNAVAAATAARALGVADDVIVAGLGATRPVRGRFELVDVGQPFKVAVDFAHTPEALAAVLGAANQVAAGRVLVVFGCGGDRDRLKRGEMGMVAQLDSDVMIITSDNPRGEDPQAIIDDILNGTETGSGAEIMVEADRRRAIATAVGLARPGDLVIVTGKGHETKQIIGDRVVEFDDRQVAIEELEKLA